MSAPVVAGFCSALRSAASQFFGLRLLASARIIARFQRLRGLGFLARGALGLLACIFFQFFGIRHSPLMMLQIVLLWIIVLLRPFQLGILLHQLFQTEALKLYRNLGIATLALATVDDSFAIFRMANVLAGLKGRPRYRLRFGRLGNAELLSARREKLRNVANGIVNGAGIAALLLSAVARGFGGIRALVFIFIRIV